MKDDFKFDLPYEFRNWFKYEINAEVNVKGLLNREILDNLNNLIFFRKRNDLISLNYLACYLGFINDATLDKMNQGLDLFFNDISVFENILNESERISDSKLKGYGNREYFNKLFYSNNYVYNRTNYEILDQNIVINDTELLTAFFSNMHNKNHQLEFTSTNLDSLEKKYDYKLVDLLPYYYLTKNFFAILSNEKRVYHRIWYPFLISIAKILSYVLTIGIIIYVLSIFIPFIKYLIVTRFETVYPYLGFPQPEIVEEGYEKFFETTFSPVYYFFYAWWNIYISFKIAALDLFCDFLDRYFKRTQIRLLLRPRLFGEKKYRWANDGVDPEGTNRILTKLFY